MAKQQLPPSFLTQSSLEDHPIFAWLEKNSRTVLLAVIGLALLLGLWYRSAANKHSAAEQDYFHAANAIEALKNPSKSASALAEIQEILARRPELHAKYDGIIAQALLLDNNLNLAHTYATSNFDRISKEASPLYLAYAKNSLTIGEGKTQDALLNAQNLKSEMDQIGKEVGQQQFGADLYIFNLIRIAMLQHTLNDKAAEARSWEELMLISREEHALKFGSPEVQKVLSHFSDKGISLMDFINFRTKK